FAAQANATATIQPMMRFYIAAFPYQQGTIIDVDTLAYRGAQIDFSGRGVNAAFVTHQSGGNFLAIYGTISAMQERLKAVSMKKNM
ncbi:hypothetical protein IL306_004821, partial [Fusarium sp. DS 682]